MARSDWEARGRKRARCVRLARTAYESIVTVRVDPGAEPRSGHDATRPDQDRRDSADRCVLSNASEGPPVSTSNSTPVSPLPADHRRFAPNLAVQLTVAAPLEADVEATPPAWPRPNFRGNRHNRRRGGRGSFRSTTTN
jgi:hypothetical protein